MRVKEIAVIEIGDVFHRALHAIAQIGRERARALGALLPVAAVPLMDPRRHRIAGAGLPPAARRQRAIEQMAVRDQHTTAIERPIDDFEGRGFQAQ